MPLYRRLSIELGVQQHARYNTEFRLTLSRLLRETNQPSASSKFGQSLGIGNCGVDCGDHCAAGLAAPR